MAPHPCAFAVQENFHQSTAKMKRMAPVSYRSPLAFRMPSRVSLMEASRPAAANRRNKYSTPPSNRNGSGPLAIASCIPGAGLGSESSKLLVEVGFLGSEGWPESSPLAIDFGTPGPGSGSESSRLFSEVGFLGVADRSAGQRIAPKVHPHLRRTNPSS